MRKNKIIMVFGTFDLLHKGHMFFLQQAKNLGGVLIVVVARDKNVINIKKLQTCWDEKKRKNKIKKLGYKTILGHKENFGFTIKKYCPNVIALGYDQKMPKKISIPKNIKIIRLKAYKPEKFKSSIIKNSKL